MVLVHLVYRSCYLKEWNISFWLSGTEYEDSILLRPDSCPFLCGSIVTLLFWKTENYFTSLQALFSLGGNLWLYHMTGNTL